MTDNILIAVDARGVATLTLNRPEVHNAFDDRLIARMTDALAELEADSAARILVLAASGKSFSAGADLTWMRRMADHSYKENYRDAMALAELMRRLDALPMPVLARVQGAAYGGGVGLVACCDIAVASERASFSLSEVRLGVIPAVISPYLVNAIGERHARRYFVSAERFDAATAHRLGLVHEVVPEDQLDAAIDGLLGELARNGPQAMGAAKRLARVVSRGPLDQDMLEETARRIADIRASAEGREGVGAFLEKRPPNWLRGG